MSTDEPPLKPPTTSDLLSTLIDEIRGLRADMRIRSGLPDARISKSKKHPEYEGKQASECPADFLLDHAGFLEWKAEKNREEGKMEYVARDEREALICRRWAAVNRGVVASPKRATFASREAQAPATPAAAPAQSGTMPTTAKSTWSGGSTWKKASGA